MAKINPKLSSILPAPLAKGLSLVALVSKGFEKELKADMIPTVERALLQGLPLENVAGLINVRRTHLRKWIDEGAEESCADPLKMELAATVLRAMSQTNLEFASVFKAIGTEDWRALAFGAKAFDKDTWGEKKEVKMELSVEAKKQHKDYSALTDEEFMLLRQLEEKAGQKT